MCGRYTLKTPVEKLARFFGLPEDPDLRPRYNIAPTQPVATVVVLTGERRLRLMRWGLVPHWAKDLSIGSRMINARAETITEKPAFRPAFRDRRCLIMADGFYEWQHKGHAKQPYYIIRKDRSPFAFAGLWERWDPPEGGGAVESCTIITTQANELVAEFHERMPVILDQKDFDLWLGADVADQESRLELLKPYPAERMDAFPVSSVVNSPTHETDECVQPIEKPEK
jgi:putative SOS response-associated peptidase YedK